MAREALSEAKEAEADVYSETKYKQALQIYEAAMKNWSRENDRFYSCQGLRQCNKFSSEGKKDC